MMNTVVAKANRIIVVISESIFLNIVNSFSVFIYILSKRVRSRIVKLCRESNQKEAGALKKLEFSWGGEGVGEGGCT